MDLLVYFIHKMLQMAEFQGKYYFLHVSSVICSSDCMRCSFSIYWNCLLGEAYSMGQQPVEQDLRLKASIRIDFVFMES